RASDEYEAPGFHQDYKKSNAENPDSGAETMYTTFRTLAIACALSGTVTAAHAAPVAIELGGEATGFIAVSNFKNSSTQDGIEGKDTNGDFNPAHNGLPEYPNYQIPVGSTNEGVFTAIIASPQSSESDYASLFSVEFHGGANLTVSNSLITQSDFSTLSAGTLTYDDANVIPTGTSTIAAADISVDLNTFEWDGNVTPEVTGDSRSSFDGPFAESGAGNGIFVSPFSPVFTPYNDGSGAGNAALYYQIAVDSVNGAGLTFTDGVLTDIDLQIDIEVSLFVAPFATFGSLDFPGTLNVDGDSYTFDVSGTGTLAIFSGVNLLMNRQGTGLLPPASPPPTTPPARPTVPVPTLDPWALVLLILLFASVAVAFHNRH
ncbi:MAG: hypothetical protein AAGH19_10175, partial [Pseudomonadota bacterium]